MSTRKSPNPPRPRVLVSRSADTNKNISRNADSVRTRLKNGARIVTVAGGEQPIELSDKDLIGSNQEWTLRIIGKSNVRIHLSAPLPENIHIVATDSSFVEVTGKVTIHAYTHATVHAFDECAVHARNFATVSVCDSALAVAVDDAVVTAYDRARVRAAGSARITAVDHTSVHLCEAAHASVCRGVRVTGPSRTNLYAVRAEGRTQPLVHEQ